MDGDGLLPQRRAARASGHFACYDTRALDRLHGEKSWTLTRMVQEWLADPATNFGVLLNSDASAAADRFRYFARAEYGETGLRPVLHIVYSAPR